MVDAFGAVGDGITNSGPAIRAALTAASAAGPGSIVRFGPGPYLIESPADGGRAHVAIEGAIGVTIEGPADAGALLVFGDNERSGIDVVDGQDVTLSRLILDYRTPPFAQGTVTAVDLAQGTFDLALDPASPDLSLPCFAHATDPWGFMAQKGVYYRLEVVLASQRLPVGGRTWRLTANGGAAALTAAGVTVGSHYVHLGRSYLAEAVRLWGGARIRLDRMTIWASPSVGVLAGHAEDSLVIDQLTVEARPSTARTISLDADGVHIIGTRAPVSIRNSRFSGMADDSINLHTRIAFVREVRGPRTLVVDPMGVFRCRPGDRLAVYDPSSGSELQVATVLNISLENGYFMRLDFLVDLPLTTPHPSDPRRATWLFNLDNASPGAIVANNTFGRHRGRSLVLHANGALVENNIAESVDGTFIDMELGPGWLEGPPSRDVTIRNNTFSGVDRAVPGIGSEGLRMVTRQTDGGMASAQATRSIVVQNNVFRTLRNASMYFSNVNGVEVIGNWTDNQILNKTGSSSASVLVERSSNLLFDSYAVSDFNPETYAGIHLGPTTQDAGTRNLVMNLLPGVPSVLR